MGVASRRASTGATRVAPYAGATAATTVTTTPTSTAATTVRGSTAADVVGTSMPTAASSSRMPTARPTPASRPSADDTIPTTSASKTIPPSTWRRVAPTARSSAVSRRRWATRTLKVFQMTNEPTSRETAAKTSRMLVKMPRPSRIAAELWSATSAPVSASTPSGSRWAIASRSSVGVTDGSPTTSIWSTSPTLSSRSCAVRRSKAARVAPARLSVLPKPTRPTTVNDPVPFWKTIRAVSPTW